MKEKQTAEEIACKKYSIKEGLNDYEENHFNSTNVNLAKAFIEGYTQCQEDMADKWFEYPKNIPPIHSENYLVFVDECIKIDLFRGDHNKFNYEIYTKNCNITHWKSLPNKPLNKQD